MLSVEEIKRAWPYSDKKWHMTILIAQELAAATHMKQCGGCTDHENMEIPTRDCCVYDRAHKLISKLNQL